MIPSPRDSTRVAWGESGVTAEPVALALGDARLSGHARTGKESADVSLNLTGAPLKLIDAFWPLGLNGKADGTLEFKGRWPEAAGKLSLAVPRLRLGDAPDAPALAIDVNGDWRRGRLALNGTIKANEGAPSSQRERKMATLACNECGLNGQALEWLARPFREEDECLVFR